jgi:hypothetical protein
MCTRLTNSLGSRTLGKFPILMFLLSLKKELRKIQCPSSICPEAFLKCTGNLMEDYFLNT